MILIELLSCDVLIQLWIRGKWCFVKIKTHQPRSNCKMKFRLRSECGVSVDWKFTTQQHSHPPSSLQVLWAFFVVFWAYLLPFNRLETKKAHAAKKLRPKMDVAARLTVWISTSDFCMGFPYVFFLPSCSVRCWRVLLGAILAEKCQFLHLDAR